MTLAAAFADLTRGRSAEPIPSFEQRKANLEKLRAVLQQNRDALISAVAEDFGIRSRQETELTELYVVEAEIAYALRRLRRWMAPKGRHVALQWLPGKAIIMPQPLGIVAILSPWNYPIQLSLAPLVAALAAGNRALLKPSEHSQKTSQLLKSMLENAFPSETVRVVLGDAATAHAVCSLPLDHIFFTGSTSVGREVARAAAENLVPVTLELGGKSPAIVDQSADLELACARIAHGKLLNSGQTCVAPDYVLLHESHLHAFPSAYRAAAQRMYGENIDADLTTILGSARVERQAALIGEARELGAEIVPLFEGARGHKAHVLAIDPSPQSRLMCEEIFGPILPVVVFSDEQEVQEWLRRLPDPLALYWFGRDRQRRDAILRSCRAGGVTINGTIWHMVQHELPFGGIGSSGTGAYHGDAGFQRFSHMKPIFIERRLSGAVLLRPPFGKLFDVVIRALRAIA
jgi:coniferyl-aldehyde dehydrogenase